MGWDIFSRDYAPLDREMFTGSVDAGFVLALQFNQGDLEPDCVGVSTRGGRGVGAERRMRGREILPIGGEMFSGSVYAGFVLALSFHHGDLEPDCVEVSTRGGRGGGLMRRIKIPPHDFPLKMQGGLMREGGRIRGTLRYDCLLPFFHQANSLHKAASRFDMDTLQRLINEGADVNSKDDDGVRL